MDTIDLSQEDIDSIVYEVSKCKSCFSRKQKQKSTKTNFTKEKVYLELA
ncbi:hypothetical protein RUMLAC_01865 [[Ruminococcus] lactaris ATCC 29176]|uniref:Uncharacterized protein n=1 Tax=[Ruminococcus] lactaris ATCC 29176 TaxID=471875 RepID=B5CQW8_9FIRM|nr:hypothetical protein RUMLAC_01865 [[Ruminococcus] lactaris ATCC 29176]